jgi:hypothetical protein
MAGVHDRQVVARCLEPYHVARIAAVLRVYGFEPRHRLASPSVGARPHAARVAMTIRPRRVATTPTPPWGFVRRLALAASRIRQ